MIHASRRLVNGVIRYLLSLEPKQNLKKKSKLNRINYRQCISCKKIAPKDNFWRVVRMSSNYKINLDYGMGRSAYLCPNIECLAHAKHKNRLQSALRAKVPENIYQNLQERLSR